MSEHERKTLTLPNKGDPPPHAPVEDGEELTYLPADGDPHTIKWRGHEFKANTPKRVNDADHIEAARGNRFFRVGNDGPKENPNLAPATSQQYRAHVVKWMKDVETVGALIQKWASERVLRQTCEVGLDDVSYLGSLVEPKLRAMRMKEGMSDGDVANTWMRAGILELPWRSS